MFAYIIRRLLLIIPTLFAVMVINFAIIQIAPGGPVEQAIAELTGSAVGATARISGAGAGEVGTEGQFDVSQQAGTSKYRGARGLDPELIERLEKEYGFDKPPFERFLHMMGQYVRFDFGSSFFRDDRVVDLVLDKLPVSISLGLWTTLLAYLISIPLGIAKAVRDGQRFDVWTSGVIIVGYAIPNFIFAILLIVLFAGGSYIDWFPLRGLVSNDFSELSLLGQIEDYFWHLGAADPGDGGERLRHHHDADQELLSGSDQPALRHHRARQGLDRTPRALRPRLPQRDADHHRRIAGGLHRHPFHRRAADRGHLLARRARALGFESLLKRDYPIIFGTLFFFTLLGLVVNLIGDLMYVIIDPRIDFETREV